jgi:GMP synthase (glutamine-hydrolysing)
LSRLAAHPVRERHTACVARGGRSRPLATVLVIQPDETDPPERLGAWLAEAGIRLRVVRPYVGDAVPRTVAEDAVVVLGGDMGANDERDHPWLTDVKALLRTTVAARTPTLGICLGGQLLAAATGGRVERGRNGTEAGTVVIQARPESAGDALFGGLPRRLRMMTLHRDAITQLPPDGVWLADSDRYPHQAFRVGSAAWGVQFHPEISPATYRNWAVSSTDEGEALRWIVDGIPDAERHDDEIVTGAKWLAEAFAEFVMDQATRSLGR